MNISSLNLLFDLDKPLSNEKKGIHDCPIPTCTGYIMIIKGIEKCETCGVIIGNSISRDPERKGNTETGDVSTTNMPIDKMMLVSSYSTKIFLGWRAFVKEYRDMNRAVTWHSQPYPERALSERFAHMKQVCDENNISPAIFDYAKTIYFDVMKELSDTEECKTKRGHNNEGLQAAAVYQAFQDEGRPKTYTEIAEIFKIESKYVSTGIKIFRGLMKHAKKCTYEIKSSSYLDYVTKYSDVLKLPFYFREEVIRVSNVANKIKILDNNTPVAIIAGCIYYCCIISGTVITNKYYIEQACGVSIPTISKVCDKLLANFNIINTCEKA